MRATATDLLRHPTWLSAWWTDWPFRQNIRQPTWWRWLLFEDGQGWLRWAADERWTRPYGYYEPPEPYTVFPPARRLYEAIRYRGAWPFQMRDEDRRQHCGW